MRIHRLVGFLAAGLVCFSSTVHAWSTGLISGFVHAGQNPQQPFQFDGQLLQHSAHDSGVGNSSATAHAFASTREGVLKGSTNASSIGGIGKAVSLAHFGDTILIDAPGFTGMIGTIHARLQVQWDLAATPGGIGDFTNATGLAELKLGDRQSLRQETLEQDSVTGALTHWLYAYQDGSPVGFDMTPTVEATFTFGTPIDLYVRLLSVSYSLSQTGQLVAAESFADRSAYWDGVVEVTVGGSPVGQFTVVSSSGTDYLGSMAPVPEFSSLWLMVLGLVFLTLRASRRGGADSR